MLLFTSGLCTCRILRLLAPYKICLVDSCLCFAYQVSFRVMEEATCTFDLVQCFYHVSAKHPKQPRRSASHGGPYYKFLEDMPVMCTQGQPQGLAGGKQDFNNCSLKCSVTYKL